MLLESKSKFPHRLNISLWSLHDLKHAKPHGAWVGILLKIKQDFANLRGATVAGFVEFQPTIYSLRVPQSTKLSPAGPALGPSSASGWFAACLLECHSHVPSCMESPAEKGSIGQVVPASLDFRLLSLRHKPLEFGRNLK